MSQAKNRHLVERWLQTAEEDLRAAEVLMRSGLHAQACFCCQQAGEKALKALWFLADADPWGHSIQRLVMDLPRGCATADAEGWLEKAALLDKFYSPPATPMGSRT